MYFLNTIWILLILALNSSSPSYMGCFNDYDAAGKKDLPYQYLKTTLPMTIEFCVTSCQSIGYSLAGLQLGYY